MYAAMPLMPFAIPSALVAQPAATAARHATGRITGRIVDAKTGAGLSDVGVQVVGTTLGTMSGVDGRFTLPAVPAGTVTIQARRIGYQAKTVTGIMLAGGQTLEQDVTLGTATVQLQAVAVTASAERGSVSKALDEQRTSTSIVNATTAEQIQRSPDADAAQAVKRVSGVTVQDGKYVIVRGLGERYTQTSLNGSRVPSPEPERKVVPLDLFPAALIDAITTAKTFTPDRPGDFSGALVDIRTREFPASRSVTFSSSLGANTAAAGRDVIRAPRVGQEWLGFGGDRRTLPSAVAAAGQTLSGVTPGAPTNALIRSFRNKWTPVADNTGLPNGSFGVSVGGNDAVLGRRVGYVASLSYSTSQEVRRDEQLIVPRADGAGGAEALSTFAGSTGRESVLWGGVANLSTMLGGASRLSLNNTYNRTSDNEARSLTGLDEQFASVLTLTRLGFVSRSVLSNQLRGEHTIGAGARQQLDWNVSRSQVSRDEPDRSDLVYQGTGANRFWRGLANDATRFFGALDERDYAGALNYRVSFGDAASAPQLKVGGYYRDVHRDSDVQAYDILNLGLEQAALRDRAESIFRRAASSDAASLLVRPSTFGGRYSADETLGAGYAMLEGGLGSRVRVIAGARVESADIQVNTLTAQLQDTVSRLKNTDVLPAVNLTVRVTDAQNLRLSATQTLSRPEYRELSPVAYVEIAANNEERGNPGLRRALIRNYDARWEWYPSGGEVLSVGVFAKRFQDPIERVFVATTGRPQIGFVNADAATNYGVELDVRKGLGFLGAPFRDITASTNATFMRSRIAITDSLTAATNPDRPMVGQSPYVVNASLGYAQPDGRFSATVLYNVFGKRITLAGVEPLPDTYERPRNVLDFALQVPVLADVTARVNGSNLLDAPYREQIGGVHRRSYRAGRVFSLGLSWRPQGRDPRPVTRP
ncbi:outer membrane protein [Roseisolibacter agri]|uniref:Outer membrane protein n=2 Tax=Roseisolibacter agri TaxID=2014610 RepID=A0AA37VCS9_9BACT|nr:outer membrane protein [Roseisolibacter agri]